MRNLHFDTLEVFINGTENQTKEIAGTKDNIVAGQAQKEKDPEQEYILIPLCTTDPLISQGPKDSEGDAGMKPTEVDERGASDKNEKDAQDTRSEFERLNQREMQTEHTNNTNSINTVSTAGPSFDNVVPSPPVNTAGPSVSTANAFEEHLFERFSPFKNAFTLPSVPNVSSMDNTGIFGNAYDDVEEEVDMNNVDTSYTASDAPFTKFLKEHPQDQVIGSLKTPIQTRHMTKINEEHSLFSLVYKLRRTNHKDFQNCLFAYFLSQMEPKKRVQALKDPSWVEAMQDALLQFKLLKVWTLVDLPRDKWAIGHTQEEGIDYDEVFAPITSIEAIRLFLAYDSFKDFVVFQMDVKSAFLYGKIEEEGVCLQPPWVLKITLSNKVYKTNKPLIKDEEAEDVDVHLYRSMIGSLMYWTINDFPARSSLYGWSGQGYLACPTCNKDTPSAKNVLESLLGTLLMNGKSKDKKRIRAEEDLNETEANRTEFLLVDKEARRVRLPDGFGSSFKKKVTADDNNITCMKSHDYHIMMQRLLPYGVQQYLPKDISPAIIELCLFFKSRNVCSKVSAKRDMGKAKKNH
ncbi:putative ribonuclease H-like domain-containing protein [Tanacetum coccineum]